MLQRKTPFELLYRSPPTYSHLKVFGCLCFATVPKSYRDKFKSRTISCVFLGYSMTKKAYKLLNLDKHNVFFFRDVIFHESIFPYSPSSPPSFFSSSPPFIPTPTSVDPLVSSPDSSSSTHVSLTPPSPVPSVPSSSLLPLRKSSRPSNPPLYLKDYVCSNVLISKDCRSLYESCLLEP